MTLTYPPEKMYIDIAFKCRKYSKLENVKI